MSVAIIPMAEELGWKAADRGIASAAFFWGYTLTQIPAGILSTRCSSLSTGPQPCTRAARQRRQSLNPTPLAGRD